MREKSGVAMGRGRFTQADVVRALRGAKEAGLDVVRIEIDRDGKIVVITGKPTEASAINEWDKVLHRDSH